MRTKLFRAAAFWMKTFAAVGMIGAIGALLAACSGGNGTGY